MLRLINSHNHSDSFPPSQICIASSPQTGKLGRQEGFREWFSETLYSLGLRITGICLPVDFPSPGINCEGKTIPGWHCNDPPFFLFCSWLESEIYELLLIQFVELFTFYFEIFCAEVAAVTGRLGVTESNK